MASPESLLIELAGPASGIEGLIAEIGPMIVPFDALSGVDGWHVDLSSASSVVMFDAPGDSPGRRAAGALLVAMDYAIRRGAGTGEQAIAVLTRESPTGLTGFSESSASLASIAHVLGIDSPRPASFDRRARGHVLCQPLVSDPALSFEERSVDWQIGDNPLSSFAVHPEGELDQVVITGSIGERWGIEVGLPPGTQIGLLDAIEPEVAEMPSFLQGVSSTLVDDAILLGWRTGQEPDPRAIGQVIQSWTKSLFDLEFADVRIVFAPASGRSAILTDMRARAKAYRLYRDAVRSGHPEPLRVIAEYQRSNEDG